MNEIALRIKELIDSSELSNTEFANKIDTNPAIISHILSGRNKPSLQLIQNINSNFTNVNLSYLVSGIGSLYKEEPIEVPQPESNFSNYNMPAEGIRHASIPGTTDITSPDKEDYSPPTPTSEPEKTEGEIEKVMIFYTNGKFKAYRP